MRNYFSALEWFAYRISRLLLNNKVLRFNHYNNSNSGKLK